MNLTRAHGRAIAKRVAKSLGWPKKDARINSLIDTISGEKFAASGERDKGASGEREAAKAIEKNCPGLRAERNARNGKPTSDVLVWRTTDGSYARLIEIKRVESLDIGTKAMAKVREQAAQDGAIGVLWRQNAKGWRLEAWWHPVGWATYSGDDAWRMIERLVGE